MTVALNNLQLAQETFAHYAAYRESRLRHRRFKHRDITPLLGQLQQHPLFEVQVVGRSVEQRDIYLVKAGNGPTKVMLWSQMHGDEPTATMALFDFLNFLQHADALDPVRQQIMKQTTLYIVPMLNPDGAEQYKRRNALEIDLNRDALRLQSPEAQLLKSLRDRYEPAFGFNLHDQSTLYTAGATSQPATISFLAPAYDHARTLNPVRERAMRTIVGMNEALQQLIPGQVARFSDEHEPRAFGDNIQKWGTSVILIESGGYPGDTEKQHIRQLNFVALVTGLSLIAGQSYTNYALEDYDQIPVNAPNLFDLVLRQVRYRHTLLDVGIVRQEVNAPHEDGFYLRGTVQELGDMSIFHGYEELQAEGLTLEPGQVYPEPLEDIQALTSSLALRLLQKGYTTVRLKTLPAENHNPRHLPLNVTSLTATVSHALRHEGDANFVLRDADGQVRYAVVNGFLQALPDAPPVPLHGLVL